MATEIIKVPDIGADSAEVIEVFVAVGDQLEAEQSLVALESDKASVEVPSPLAGKVLSIHVSVGDQLSEGMDLLELEVESAAEEPSAQESNSEAGSAAGEELEEAASTAASESASETVASSAEVLYLVPDVGADQAEIIEVCVSVGDEVAEGDSIVVAESDKASLELPAESSGTVVALYVSEGDKVMQGFDLVTIRGAASVSAETAQEVSATENAQPVASEQGSSETGDEPPQSLSEPKSEEFGVPDLGSDEAEIIEMPVSVGDSVEEGDTIVVVETDKASVDVPAEASGELTAIHVEVGGKIAQGDKLVTMLVQGAAAEAPVPAQQIAAPEKSEPAKEKAPQTAKVDSPVSAVSVSPSSDVHAGPAVRKLARELGVDLGQVKPSGQKGRVLKDDVHAFVKQKLSSVGSAAAGGAGIPEIPAVDWSQFGDIDTQPMSRIGKVTAANMSRNWLNVPHVTQFDNADVTELEDYRGYLKPEGVARGIKMTPLAFLLKASTVALQENPKFNTALHQNGGDLVERKFFHVSIAVDTPLGLMVPVIRDVDQKDIWQLASEVSSLAMKAKEGKLSPKEMQGASFTISSLGAIGGTGFTPIVPAPQVGILGVSKTSIQPVWDGTTFVPRKLMPLSLSYDHRVVNGADAGKFMTCLVEVLGDLNRIWNG